MGDKWHLTLGTDREIRWGKNRVPALLLTVFREEDKYMHEPYAIAIDEFNARPDDTPDPQDDLDEGARDETALNRWSADDDPDEGGEGDHPGGIWEEFDSIPRTDLYGYAAPVATIVTRLDLMGFDASRCTDELREYFELSYEPGNDLYDLVHSSDTAPLTCAELVDIGLRAYRDTWGTDPRTRDLSRLEQLCLEVFDFVREREYEHDQDPRLLLGALLHGIDPTTQLRLDLSDLLHAGYYFDRHEKLSATALEELQAAAESTGPIIVITEGVFDVEVLTRGLRLVRPDVAGYFTFLDMKQTNAAGGTDRVVANVKAFAAAGVMNRVVALLDNDAAGHAAERQLAKVALPDRFRVRRLPYLDYARNYPTLGPSTPSGSGDDVNGRACSVEFYFGLDCLRDPHTGTLVDVRWTSFLQGDVREYQGELVDKKNVQDRIRTMLTDAEAGITPLDDRWDALRAVARTLVDAARGKPHPAPNRATTQR
ncbi:hypothetical protein [Embleya sp. NPDC020630]|uniref:hypothetical protein n=1 Tax=Embleya sp. NPDC020630 TaxID=3363979 RepID=UPI0037987688